MYHVDGVEVRSVCHVWERPGVQVQAESFRQFRNWHSCDYPVRHLASCDGRWDWLASVYRQEETGRFYLLQLSQRDVVQADRSLSDALSAAVALCNQGNQQTSSFERL